MAENVISSFSTSSADKKIVYGASSSVSLAPISVMTGTSFTETTVIETVAISSTVNVSPSETEKDHKIFGIFEIVSNHYGKAHMHA